MLQNLPYFWKRTMEKEMKNEVIPLGHFTKHKTLISEVLGM